MYHQVFTRKQRNRPYASHDEDCPEAVKRLTFAIGETAKEERRHANMSQINNIHEAFQTTSPALQLSVASFQQAETLF
jgi:hypothetical protein